jgi:AcrR family transcriptional regulator
LTRESDDGSKTAIMASLLSEARAELVRQRILEGVAAVLGRGEAWTFANVAKAAAVPERTLYRYFATREALLRAIFDWANARIGFHGQLPTDAAGLASLVRRAFPGFDGLAPVIRELLIAPEGRLARLGNKLARQRAALEAARHEAPGLDAVSTRRVAAVLQLLTSAATWQALREYWDMDGTEAAETSALAAELLLRGARLRAGAARRKRKAVTKRARPEVTS